MMSTCISGKNKKRKKSNYCLLEVFHSMVNLNQLSADDIQRIALWVKFATDGTVIFPRKQVDISCTLSPLHERPGPVFLGN